VLMTPFQSWHGWLKPNLPAVATIDNTLKTKFGQISENQAQNGWGNQDDHQVEADDFRCCPPISSVHLFPQS